MKVGAVLVLGLLSLDLVSVSAIARDLTPRQQPEPKLNMPRPESMPMDSAEPVPGAQLPNADPFQLLENSPEVQADLQLTRDQLSRLDRASRNFRETLRELTSRRNDLGPDVRREKIAGHINDTRAMIARELSPAQLGRLQQIMLQLEGPCLAVIDPPLAEHLGLSSEQHEQIKQACAARLAQMQSAFLPVAAGASTCEAMSDNRRRVEIIRRDADEAIFSLLRPPQKELLRRLSGKKIVLTPPMPPQCN